MKHHLFALPVLLTVLTANGQAPQQTVPSFNGRWQISLSVQGNDASDACELTAEGKTIRGTCSRFGAATGTLEGDKVVLNTDGAESKLVFTGTLKNGSFQGTVEVLAYGVQGEFHAEPQGR